MDKPVALYLELGAEPFAAAGHYMMPPDKLARLRGALDPQHPLAEFLRIKRLIARFPTLPRLSDPFLVKWLQRECAAAAKLVAWTTAATRL